MTDEADSAGHIFRGDPISLHEALVAHPNPLRPLRMTLQPEQWLPRIARRVADRRQLVDATTRAACERALLDLSRSNLSEFDVVLLRAPVATSNARGWLAGFNTAHLAGADSASEASHQLTVLLHARFGPGHIAWASELLDYVSGDALLEALFSGALSPYLGHRRARQALEAFFADINYDHAQPQPIAAAPQPTAGNLDGILTLVLRALAHGRLFERSRTPAASRPIEGSHGGDLGLGTRIIEEATTSGLVILTGLPGMGKTSGLRRYDLPRLDARRSNMADFRRFVDTNRGRLIAIDSFYLLGEALSPVVAACRHSHCPLILVSRPPADQWKQLDSVRNWQGQPPVIFRVQAASAAELRHRMGPLLPAERSGIAEVDWTELHELSGGNHRMAWSILGLGANLGIFPTQESLGLLCSWTRQDHPEQPLRTYGLFDVEWFTDLWDDCRDRLFPFAEAFALLKEIAYRPLLRADLPSFTDHEGKMVQRLLDFDVLQSPEDGNALQIRGQVLAHFLRDTNAERFWRPALRAPPSYWADDEA